MRLADRWGYAVELAGCVSEEVADEAPTGDGLAMPVLQRDFVPALLAPARADGYHGAASRDKASVSYRKVVSQLLAQ